MTESNNQAADPAELEKFNAMASSWWDPDGDFRPLHDLNPIRMEFIAQHCNLAEARVADVGCGAGLLSEAMAKAGAAVTGVDLAAAALDVARLHLHESELDVDYQLTSVFDFAQSHPAAFDIVTCLEMLEHVPDPEATLAAAARLLKPGGKLFVSTLNRTLRSFLLGIVGAEYVMNLLPRGTHTYTKFIKPSEMRSAARRAGLSLEAIKGLHYDPVRRKGWLNEDPSVNYLMVFSR